MGRCVAINCIVYFMLVFCVLACRMIVLGTGNSTRVIVDTTVPSPLLLAIHGCVGIRSVGMR